MEIVRQCDISYRLDGHTHQGKVRIEQNAAHDKARYRAIIEASALHGTFGGYADSQEMALDYLNLAMQAKGAEAIMFACHPAYAPGKRLTYGMQCAISYRLDGEAHQGDMRIEQIEEDGKKRYRARVLSSALQGTVGGFAESAELALDFLNLALQAEGAEEISVAWHPGAARAKALHPDFQSAISYRLDGQLQQGILHIEQSEQQGKERYRAMLVSSRLQGTVGGEADSLELALDFLNLALQAEGADDITFAREMLPPAA